MTDPKTLEHCRKELAKLERRKARNGGKAPRHIETLMARYRETIRRLS